MHKLSFIAMSICAAAMALACQQEKTCLDNESSDNQEQTFTFTIAQDDLDTKAGYDSNDRLVWKSGDKILVHGEGSSSSYRQVVTLSSSNISSDGLTATVPVPSGLKAYDRSDKGYVSKYYAQYPADAAPDGKLYYFSVFNSTNKIMRAGCDDGNKKFTFYDLSATLAFKVSGDYDEYAFYGNDSETIGYKHYMVRYVKTNSGYVTEFPYTGEDLGGTGESIKKIYNDYLTCDGVTQNYVHIPNTIDFSKGITIDFYKNGSVVATYKRTSSITVTRGKIRHIGDLTAELSGNPGGHDDPPAPNGDLCTDIGTTPMVMAYYTYYTEDLPEVSKLTHINYSFGKIKNPSDGTGGITVKDTDRLKKVVALKSKNSSLKVLLAVGGDGAGGFSLMARSDSKRRDFVQSAYDIIRDYKLDGIDLDWEFPTKDNGLDYSSSDKENFDKLVKELRAKLGTSKIISVAANSSPKYYNFSNIMKYVDYLNVMTYDMGRAPDGFNSPLHTPYLFDQTSVEKAMKKYVNEVGISKKRLNVGVPFYGKAQKGSSVYNGSDSYTVNFNEMKSILEDGWYERGNKSVKGYNTEKWDEGAMSPYLVDKNGKMVLNFENAKSVYYKGRFVYEQGYLGAMFWEYRADDSNQTLLKALYKGVHNQSL
ncbi:MAG: hypothetical protein J5520_02710 [Bacteroidales bacterium]|nr:hypothetical protein [Bacteroidales bacterium]